MNSFIFLLKMLLVVAVVMALFWLGYNWGYNDGKLAKGYWEKTTRIDTVEVWKFKANKP